MTTPDKQALFNATTTIYKEIARLRRGLPIALAKQRTEMDKMRTRSRYTTQIQELKRQYAAVDSQLHAIITADAEG